MDDKKKEKKGVQKTAYPLPYIVPHLQDWPIAKLYQQRDAFVEEVHGITMKELLKGTRKEALSEQLAKVVYLERDRLVHSPWRIDPPDEMDFWSDIRQQLLKNSLDRNETQQEEINEELLSRIIWRYVEEITGSFSTTTYRFARKALPMGFNMLLNAARFMYKGPKEKLQIAGEVEHIRSLMQAGGTIILVPTHFSNLDSILIGWTADRIGLTAFSYGAGLNLYNTKLLAFFFSRLGAYALDRRKKNDFYLQTLKSFSQASIEQGVHTLFFPGGTRSRSGELETKLKMGLLGTAIDAQYNRIKEGKKEKIYIVPVVLNYHFVLEAKGLIDQYLQQTGKELYMVEKKAFGGAWNLIKYIWKFFSATSEIIVNFGKPLDVIGNFVDDKGHSLDQFGRKIDLNDYFISEEELKADRQRNEQYTKMLAQRLVQRYHVENIVLTSHLVAFVAFKILIKQYPKLDLYGILRLPEEDRVIPYDLFEDNIRLLCKELRKMAEQAKIQLSEKMSQWEIGEIIKDGLANVGTFHVKKALMFDKNGNINSEDLNLLYYYHNRMEGYHLEKFMEVRPK